MEVNIFKYLHLKGFRTGLLGMWIILSYRSLSGGGEGKQEIGRTGQRYEENSEKKKGISTELQESGWQNEYRYRFYLPFMVFEK